MFSNQTIPNAHPLHAGKVGRLSQARLGDHFAGIGQLGQQGLDVSEVGGHGAKVAVVDAQADLGGVLFGPSLSPGQLFTIVDFQQDLSLIHI